VKAPPYGYARAGSLAEAFELWRSAGPAAQVIAGGQSLLAALAFRLSEPSTLIDISRVAELNGVAADGNVIRVGALTTHAELGRNALVTSAVPLLHEAVPLIAHAAIRNRGTIGGSLAYADPAAELPACCVALDATIIAQNSHGERRIPAGQFFTGLFTTALAPNELIKAIEFLRPRPGERSTIVEIARRAGDYAMAGIVAKATVTGDQLTAPRLVFFGVGAGPVLAPRAAAILDGKPMSDETIKAAATALDHDLDPPADPHGGPDMKRQLARTLLARAVRRLIA
jgi:aerobic carbon-monoxide dehydrogenase medium subunit